MPTTHASTGSSLLLASLLASLLAAACAATGAPAAPPAVGTQLAFEGRLAHVDTAPWAYDGNARLVVATDSYGRMAVELPARWNLCRARPFGDIGAYAVGDRVRVVGTVTAAGTVTVCEQPAHALARLP